MSKVTKRKHVMKEMQTDDFEPPAPNQQIVRIIGSRGNNLHEVESSEPLTTTDGGDVNTDADKFLVSMPTKFRKNVWVKRGDYVIVEPIEEGDKVKAEIVRILTPQHIKEFTKDGIWPAKFTKTQPNRTNENDNDSNDSDHGFEKNTNRQNQYVEPDSDDSDDSTSSSEDEDD